jgi:hypothetical protein
MRYRKIKFGIIVRYFDGFLAVLVCDLTSYMEMSWVACSQELPESMEKLQRK